MGRMIDLRPLTRDQANAWIDAHHRHHPPVTAHRFAIGAFVDGRMVGAIVIASPTAQALNDGLTFEVTRLCCVGGQHNVASRLIGSAYRASKAMGVRRLVSYTRHDESGCCFQAAGWCPVAPVKGRPWHRNERRQPILPGVYSPTTEIVDRVRWEIAIA